MVVAEAKKVEKQEAGAAAPAAPAWLAQAAGFVPRKLGELNGFLREVYSELKKVTWPSFPEVRATTLVVIATTVFFGFYLYGLDLGFSWILSYILKK